MLAASNIFNTRITVNMAHSVKWMILLLNFSEGLGQVTIYLYTINQKIEYLYSHKDGNVRFTYSKKVTILKNTKWFRMF